MGLLRGSALAVVQQRQLGNSELCFEKLNQLNIFVCVKWMNIFVCFILKWDWTEQIYQWHQWQIDCYPIEKEGQKSLSLARISKVPHQVKVVPSLVPAIPARELLEGRDYLSNIGWVPSSAPGMWQVLDPCFFECANAPRCWEPRRSDLHLWAHSERHLQMPFISTS